MVQTRRFQQLLMAQMFLILSSITYGAQIAEPFRLEKKSTDLATSQATLILTDLRSRALITPRSAATSSGSAKAGGNPTRNAGANNIDSSQRSRASESHESRPIGLMAKKSDWLKAIYSRGWVDSSNVNRLLADKLVFYRTVQKELGEDADKYLISSMGLRDFLIREKLVDQNGKIIASPEAIETALYKRFPTGVTVRPAVGVSPRETGLGLFADTDDFIAELLQPKSKLYSVETHDRPIRSSILGLVASGEAVVLQADVLRAGADQARAAGHKSSTYLKWRELRVHTYAGAVLPKATAQPWHGRDQTSDEDKQRAQNFVQEFLGRFPREITHHQAWSFDVVLLSNGDMKIAELITNRGQRGAWSSYLEQPQVIAAYTEAFETQFAEELPGIGGMLARNGFGNMVAYLGKRFELTQKSISRKWSRTQETETSNEQKQNSSRL